MKPPNRGGPTTEGLMGPGGCSWRDLNEFAFNEVGPWQQPFHAEVPVLPARKRKLEHFATVGGGGGAGGCASPERGNQLA